MGEGALGSTVERIRPRQTPRAEAGGLPIVYAQDLFRPKLTSLCRVKGALPMRGVAVTFGHSGTAKTAFALDRDLRIALGWEWFGRKVERCGVAYLAAEGAAGIGNRVAAWLKHNGISEGTDVPFALVPATVDLFEKDVAAVVAALREIAAHLSAPLGKLTVDTVSKTLGAGKENTDDLAVYLANCERIASEFDIVVELIHHRPHDSEQRRLRGHSSFGAGVETALLLERHGETITADCMKMKDGPDDWRVSFALETVILGEDDDGENVTSVVIVPKGETAKPPPKRDQPKLGVHATNALRAIREAFAPVNPIHNSCFERPFTIEQMDETLRGAGIGVERRANITEARAQLQSRGLIRIKAGNVTITPAGWSFVL